MLTYPNIDPVAIAIGPLKVHWYGLMYLFGFAAAWWLSIYRAKTRSAVIRPEQAESMIFHGAMGVVIGARVGYVIFYDFANWMNDLTLIVRVWDGGMSFHGGLIGTALGLYIFSRKINRNFFDIVDFIAPFAPIGIFFGRIGNFIGGELWGRQADVSWAMIFPDDKLQVPRHPSQLYEAFLEGIVLFAILFWFSSKPRPRAAVIGLFVMFYGIFRFSVEFFREPDSHIMFDLFGWMTRGQILSTPMIIVGACLVFWAYRYGPVFQEEAIAPEEKAAESKATPSTTNKRPKAKKKRKKSKK